MKVVYVGQRQYFTGQPPCLVIVLEPLMRTREHALGLSLVAHIAEVGDE